MIRAFLGFERPDEGRVEVYGVDPHRDRAAAVRSVGYVPQAASLYRGLTIGDHFAIARSARPTFDTTFAGDHVRRVGLTLDRPAGQLSGGEAAQVMLAMALGTRAPVLLLDEPLASLDPLARRDFLTALVAEVRSRGATALLSSHIVTDVEQACDRLMVLADGRLVLDESVKSARAMFRIAPVAGVGPAGVVGRFAGPDGEPLALVAGDAAGRSATLEEIVLGHLAAAQDGRASTAA